MIETVLYGLEVVKYGILYNLIYEKRGKRAWVAMLIGSIYFVLFGVLYPEFSSSGKAALGYTAATVTMLFLLQGNWKQRGAETLVLFLVSVMLEQIVSIPFEVVDLYVDIEGLLGNGINVILSAIGIVILFLVSLWKKKNKYTKTSVLNGNGIYVLVLFMVIEMLITAAGLNLTRSYIPNRRFSIFVIVFVAITYLAIGMLGIFVIHIRKVNAKMESMLQNEILLKEMQKSYYEALLEKEEETRKYRHDMASHLLCLNGFAQTGKMNELKQYLEEMQQQVTEIQHKCYTTGNQVIDVVTNHHLATLGNEVAVRVVGYLEERLPIENMALCTIYSNLLKNAVEELERDERKEKRLWIELLQGTEYMQIEIRNSMSEKSLKKKHLFVTEKTDKRSHGIGLNNAKKVAKENGAWLELEQKEGVFIARMIIKNI